MFKRFVTFVGLLSVFIALFRNILGADKISFTYIVNVFASTPRYQPTLFFEGVSLGDWGVFNWLRNFIQLFISGLDTFLYLGQQCVSILKWLFDVLQNLFGPLFGLPSSSGQIPGGGGGGRW